jgi:hypothetical protein
MPDKKPLSVKVLNILLWLKIAALPLILLMYFATSDVADATERSVAAGMRQALIERFNVSYGYSAYEFGYLVGNLGIKIIPAILLLIFVAKRKFTWVIIFLCLDFLFALSSGFPLLSIVVVVLVVTNPTRNYLKRKNSDVPPPSAPIDYDLMTK